MENKKECKVFGYGKYPDKETGEMMLRVLIGIKSENEKYYGMMIAPAIFLKYDEQLEESLKYAIDNKNLTRTYYTTTDNIITGKTKVDAIYVENI
ncbi:MAG TPA: hypothetical protein IAB58_05610 [Candidatus Pelethosoma merdigallinarum]|nr:hypothetical protein [Candidatus Pelethosoma merdigallinarum]